MEKRKQKYGFGSFGTVKISILEGTIISAFFPEAEEMTIKKIQERVDYSYERVNSSLKSLAKNQIIIEKQTGKTLVYSLNLENLYVESMGFSAYMLGRESEFIKNHNLIFKAIREIENNSATLIVILFGSYSKGTETKKSDIDLIIACLPGEENKIENFVKSLRHKYGIIFAPVVIPFYEFTKIKEDNIELWNDLKMYGIVFKGEDNFYYWMYKNGKN